MNYLIKKANQNLRNSNLDDAITLCRQAINKNPDFAWGYYLLGEALLKQSDLENSLYYYSKALELYPKSAWFNYGLGKVLLQQDQPSEALGYFQKALEINPQYYEFDIALGMTFEKLNDIEEALVCFRRVCTNQPDFVAGYYELAKLLIKLNQYTTETIKCYQKVIELKPDYFKEVYYDLSRCLIQGKMWMQVVEIYQKAMEIEVMPTQAYNYFQYAFAQLGQIDQAINICQEAIRIMPNSLGLYWNLGNLFYQQQFWDKAISNYSKVVELDPTYLKGRPYQKLGDAFVKLQRWDDAKKAYTKNNLQQRRIYDKIWESLNKPIVALDNNYNFPIDIEPQLAEVYFTKTSNFYQLELASIKTLDGTPYIEKLGIENIYQFSQNLKKLVSYKSSSSKIIYEFQLDAVNNGYLESICPWSGEILKSNQSFLIDGKYYSILAYRFIGHTTYYLLIGFVGGNKLCLYFPSAGLIVKFRAQASMAVSWCLKLQSYMVSKWLDVKNYLSENESKKLVSITGVMHHFGHTVLNEYSSYQELFDENLLDNFKKFIVGICEFIPFEQLFPEVEQEKIIRTSDYSFETFTFIIKNNFFAIRPTNPKYDLNRKLATRIYHASVNSCSQTYLQEMEAAKKCFPLLWFEIRTNDRIWLNQAEGIAEIANHLYSDYPNLGIIFAGWSYTDRENVTDHRGSKRDQQVVQKSQALMNPNIPTFTIVGHKIYEKIAWAGIAELHIVGHGSGYIFPSIAHKQAIIHTNKGWYPVDGIKEHCDEFHKDHPTVSAVPIEHINDYSDNKHFHVKNYYCNWEGIYNETVKLLKTLDLKM
ncbi:tetratricopeptide repeat protein [Okeania sp. SIO1I7]|uniref:tetratricopeptide repeat protein n=1 Tax=Okeania sp. SIO1I7 TaxID=2607772 RepID=UPI0013F6C09D|nr:tetratricopeptide repeat protein [Okeania sp. SIO1I7]NET24735.1 tetratricopeptide repeat protein [Okeania sp. SIO1I7]